MIPLSVSTEHWSCHMTKCDEWPWKPQAETVVESTPRANPKTDPAQHNSLLAWHGTNMRLLFFCCFPLPSSVPQSPPALLQRDLYSYLHLSSPLTSSDHSDHELLRPRIEQLLPPGPGLGHRACLPNKKADENLTTLPVGPSLFILAILYLLQSRGQHRQTQ